MLGSDAERLRDSSSQAAEDHGTPGDAIAKRARGFFGMQRHAQRFPRRREDAAYRALPLREDVDEFNGEGESEGETIIQKRERFSHELRPSETCHTPFKIQIP